MNLLISLVVIQQEWDDNLASVAQAYANKCIFQHNANRNEEASTKVGENLYVTSSTSFAESSDLSKVVDSWDDEKNYYHLGTNNCDPGKMCGHYTQVRVHDHKIVPT